MKYELLPEQVVSIFGYPEPLLEESVVKAAVQELVDDRKKLLADKRALMLEVKQLKERLRTLEGLHEEDENTAWNPIKKPPPRWKWLVMEPPGLEPGTRGL